MVNNHTSSEPTENSHNHLKIIGIYPIDRDHITEWHINDGSATLDSISDENFNGPNIDIACQQAAIDYLKSKLRIQNGEVNVVSARMAKNVYSRFLWVTL